MTSEEIKIFEQRLEKWLQAAESGKYKQCFGQLKDPLSGSLCFLGVGCEVSQLGYWDRGGAYTIKKEKSYFGMPIWIKEFYGYEPINTNYNSQLSYLNDDQKMTFKEIVNFVRNNKSLMFKWARSKSV